jgi:hypothetical protein
MQKSDISFETVSGHTVARICRNFITKNHRETNEDAANGGRICEIPGNDKCPVRVLKLYVSKLNKDNHWLWQRCDPTWKETHTWYGKQKLGHNKIAMMMKSISVICHLPKEYTNHCIRVSCCTLLGELGFCDTDVRAVSKHKSIESLALYKRVKLDRKVGMALSMADAIGLVGNKDAIAPQQLEETGTNVDIAPLLQAETGTNVEGTYNNFGGLELFTGDQKNAILDELASGGRGMTSNFVDNLAAVKNVPDLATSSSTKKVIFIQNCSNVSLNIQM